MQLLGLIGYPLSHAWSATYFSDKFSREKITNIAYRLLPLKQIGMLPDLIRRHPELTGFNVTIPYKVAILPLLDDQDEKAREIGAVNTVTISRDGETFRLKGFNTDAEGFLSSLPEPLNHEKALILGTGGAARAVAWALKQRGIGFRFVSRQKKGGDTVDYNSINLNLLDDYTFIINTTPIGMYPDVEAAPNFPYALLSGKHFLYDLIYNPAQTLFLSKGLAAGAKTTNGYSMLVGQAEAAFRIFTRTQP